MPGKLRTCLNLTRGLFKALVAPTHAWEERKLCLDSVDIVSIDIFNTILLHEDDLDKQARRTVIDKLIHIHESKRKPRALSASKVEKLLHNIRRQSLEEQLNGVARRELRRRDLYARFLELQGYGDESTGLPEELEDLEIETVYRRTTVNEDARIFIEDALRAGRRVIALSDSWFPSEKLSILLRRHGIEGIERIYSSCECSADKFHGELFHLLMNEQGIDPSRVLHVGDRYLSDFISPAALSLKAIRVRPKKDNKPHLADGTDEDAQAFIIGFDAIGPVISAFCVLLLDRVRELRLRRLGFLARDGDLLLRATEVFLREAADSHSSSIELEYLYFSRRSTALAGLKRIDRDALEAVERVHGPGYSTWDVIEYYNLADHNGIAEALEGAPCAAPSDFFEREDVIYFVEESVREQSLLLAEYLATNRIGTDSEFCLVDIGWRGTIQSSLNRISSDEIPKVALTGLYLGLWDPFSAQANGKNNSIGVIGDYRRGRNLLEASPWHFAIPLEAICRAAHGSVMGYRRSHSGEVVPSFGTESPARRQELMDRRIVNSIRRGVLARIEKDALRRYDRPINLRILRIQSQLQLLRIAFFPSKTELRIIGSLNHTENHLPASARPLIFPFDRSLLSRPGLWLNGLKSPWRGGYVKATGGVISSILYLILEAALSDFPRGTAIIFKAIRRLTSPQLHSPRGEPRAPRNGPPPPGNTST